MPVSFASKETIVFILATFNFIQSYVIISKLLQTSRTTDLAMEATADGSFDTNNVATAQAETLRQKGNEAFNCRHFLEAKNLYSQAIACHNTNHLLYGNRSAALYQLKDFHAALQDAEKAIEISPDWSKGYLRKGVACESLQLWDEAIDAFETILRLNNEEIVVSKAKIAITRVNFRRKKSVVTKGFLFGKNTSDIYTEKENVSQYTTQRSWQLMLKKLLDGCNKRGMNRQGESVVLDDGIFAKLLQENEFQQLIYPGIPTEQLIHAPKNLQTLLEDPWYEHELLAIMPKVKAKAASVLNNVKKRGAEQGDFMDTITERVLIPQVMQEAFGREVLAMVHRVNYQKHVKLANDVRLLADPNSDFATWDQLDDEFLNELLANNNSSVRGTAILDGFMGDEWTQLLLNDVSRMATNGLLRTTTTSEHIMSQQKDKASLLGAKLRFVEYQDCTAEYPALAELIEKVHALPYEINKKRPDKAKLCAQFSRCTAIQQLPAGHHQPLRLDCGAGDKNNGFKLTCIYFFNAVDTKNKRTSLSLRTALRENSTRQVYPEPDRLVVFRSQSVFNEITTVPDGEDLYYLTFWIHGQSLQ